MNEKMNHSEFRHVCKNSRAEHRLYITMTLKERGGDRGYMRVYCMFGSFNGECSFFQCAQRKWCLKLCLNNRGFNF